MAVGAMATSSELRKPKRVNPARKQLPARRSAGSTPHRSNCRLPVGGPGLAKARVRARRSASSLEAHRAWK